MEDEKDDYFLSKNGYKFCAFCGVDTNDGMALADWVCEQWQVKFPAHMHCAIKALVDKRFDELNMEGFR